MRIKQKYMIDFAKGITWLLVLFLINYFNQVNNFPNKYFDVIYMDADHSYDALKRDIELYLPKCNKIIGGHDYGDDHPEVKKVVEDLFKKPDIVFCDGSWFKVIGF